METVVEHRNIFLIESTVPEIDALANEKLLQGTLTINISDGFTRFVCDSFTLEVFPVEIHDLLESDQRIEVVEVGNEYVFSLDQPMMMEGVDELG